MKKRICGITGAAVAVFSAVTAGYALGKKEPQRSAAPIICSGILGVMVGSMIAVIPQVMETKQKLVDLRFKIKKVLERLDPEEYDLIDYKYFKNRHIDGFDHTSRNYFRRQHKVIEHLEELLSYIDLSEDKFKRDYYDIPFIRAIADASRYENAG